MKIPLKMLSVLAGIGIVWGGSALALPADTADNVIKQLTAPLSSGGVHDHSDHDHSEEDLTKLPLGDGKYTLTGPKKGYIYLQSKPQDGRGASKDGEWIDKANGTFDLTRKAVVDGEVHWQSELTIERKGDKRILTGNRLPDHPTGSFPISKSDDAYQYDQNPNSIREQLFRVELPANPTAAKMASPVNSGAIGIMLTGSLIFNGLDASGRDAVAHETQDAVTGTPSKAGNTTITT
ncbi:hypothetical protein [Cohnella fermenti]|uniref:Uncharacterized protein n=1 Tax=Cohnella fermenti TaxID=2565925 RepID=A0A4S4BSD9_9BACL|nr:hypothetical protein [Cohnella fermenti]THF77146.1 hypothetical protein E6C55_17440 [Cohnella fermenti]